jgi:hypothetical protein
MVLSDNKISINLSFRSDKKLQKITVRNQVITELNNNQAKMTIVHIKDFEEGVNLTPEKKQQTFMLN